MEIKLDSNFFFRPQIFIFSQLSEKERTAAHRVEVARGK